MRVFACTKDPANVVTSETHPLSWDDLKKSGDGVYEPMNHKHTRIVVIRSPWGTVILYYDGNGLLDPASEHAWNETKFRHTKERVCFEIKA